MIRTTLKYALWAALLFVAYRGANFYATYKTAMHIGECSSAENLCQLAKRKASNEEVTSETAKVFACVRARQSAFESLLSPIPKGFLNPAPGSLSHEDAEGACGLV